MKFRPILSITIALVIGHLINAPARSDEGEYKRHVSPHVAKQLDYETKRFHDLATRINDKIDEGGKHPAYTRYHFVAWNYLHPLMASGHWVPKTSKGWQFTTLVLPEDVTSLKMGIVAIFYTALVADHNHMSGSPPARYMGTLKILSRLLRPPRLVHSNDRGKTLPLQAFLHNPSVMCLYYAANVLIAEMNFSYGQFGEAQRHYDLALEVLSPNRLNPRFNADKMRQNLTESSSLAKRKHEQLLSHGKKPYEAYRKAAFDKLFDRASLNNLKRHMPPYLAELLPPEELPKFRFTPLLRLCEKP